MAEKSILKNNQGQSTVEYILLLAVVISLFSVVFNSAAFQNLLGPEGSFFQATAAKIEFSYRNGYPGDVRFRAPNYSGLDSPTINRNRFFSPRDPYPGN